MNSHGPLRGQARYISQATWTTAGGAAVCVRPPTTLVPGANRAPRPMQPSTRCYEQTPAPTQKRQAALPIGETSTTIIGCEVLPLLSRPAEECKLGWVIGLACILCATLVLMPIGRTLESWSTDSQTYLATSLSEETQSWPGEPNIGGGSPTLKDPFASWASRAVLEQFPTPRTILVHLPQTSAPQAELVNPQ